MTIELMAQGVQRDEIINIYVKQLGMSRTEAEFVVALELGEVTGDVIEVDQDGKEMKSDDRHQN